MTQLFEAAFSPVNVVPTFLLLLVILYWLAVILGALDVGFLDFDIEADYESDIQIDFEINSEADMQSGAGWFNEVLSFFNLGKIPFMVFLSCLTLPMWMISINTNHYLGISNVWISLVLLIPNFFVSLFIAKVLSFPLVGLFKKLNDEGPGKSDLVGKVCQVKIECSAQRPGQVEIMHNGASYIVTAHTREGVLVKGSQGLVVDFNETGDHYLVAPYVTV